MSRPLEAVGAVHARHVLARRFQVLARELAELAPPGRIVDIGCGSGRLALALAELRQDVSVEGFDVLVRPGTAIPVRAFDGAHIPLDDGAVDAVLLVDVLHHVDDPTALLAECARVASVVIVKDHFAEGPLDHATLRLMDWVGNRPHGVVLPYRYFSRAGWKRMCAAARLVPERTGALGDLYPFPFSAVFGRGLHFVTRLKRV